MRHKFLLSLSHPGILLQQPEGTKTKGKNLEETESRQLMCHDVGHLFHFLFISYVCGSAQKIKSCKKLEITCNSSPFSS